MAYKVLTSKKKYTHTHTHTHTHAYTHAHTYTHTHIHTKGGAPPRHTHTPPPPVNLQLVNHISMYMICYRDSIHVCISNWHGIFPIGMSVISSISSGWNHKGIYNGTRLQTQCNALWVTRCASSVETHISISSVIKRSGNETLVISADIYLKSISLSSAYMRHV